jgi:protein-L-isoaspartate(D-aspartate) O-methyltransferase
MGAVTDQTADLRAHLVQTLKAHGCLRSAAVEAAFLEVPRHTFLPGFPAQLVYTDRSFPTKHREGMAISSSSQPAIMAIMLEQLALQRGQRVLEIGAGTGFNAALMAQIVGEDGQVVTMDIDEDLVLSARQHLAAAGLARVEVLCGDGGFGHPAAAPYDRIILTVGAWDIAPAWIEQLSQGGRLVLPLSLRHVQKSVAFERRDDHLESVSVEDCGFMPLRGAFAGPQRIIRLAPGPGPYLVVDGDRPVDADRLFDALNAAHVEVPTGITATLREIFGSLSLWLALEDPDACSLGIYAEPSVVDGSAVPLLVEGPAGDKKFRSTFALVGNAGLVALSRPLAPHKELDASVPLSLVSFRAEPQLVKRMNAHLMSWEAAGRPRSDALCVCAYPKAPGHPLTADASVLAKRWTTLVVSRV